MAKQTWQDVGVNFSGSNQAMQNAQQGFAQTQAASGGILDRITKEEQIKQDQANKLIEQQRLADVLQMQREGAIDARTFNEGKLAQGRDELLLREAANTADAGYKDKMLANDALKIGYTKSQADAAVAQKNALIDAQKAEKIGNQYLALVASGATEAQLKDFKEANKNFGLTAQQATVLKSSTGTGTSDLFYNKDTGEPTYIPRGGTVPKGYVSESIYKEQVKDKHDTSKNPTTVAEAAKGIKEGRWWGTAAGNKETALEEGTGLTNRLITEAGVLPKDAEKMASEGINAATVNGTFYPDLFKGYVDSLKGVRLGTPKTTEKGKSLTDYGLTD